MEYVRRYWNELVRLKVYSLYLAYYLRHDEKTNFHIKVFLAITSNSSIAAWVIWKDGIMPYVWSSIIAASQTISVIKDLLPLQSRLKSLASLSVGMQELCRKAEDQWFFIENGEWPINKIHSATIALMKSREDLVNQGFGNTSLPVKKKLLTLAEADAAIYLKARYNVEAQR